MRYWVSQHEVALELPEGFEVTSDGSVFGTDTEFALYREPSRPVADPVARREFIEGRSYVDEFISEQLTADGWLTTFRCDRGLGFELGRQLGDTRVVFWGDSLASDAAIERIVTWCKEAALKAS